jgi:hypothetical protein
MLAKRIWSSASFSGALLISTSATRHAAAIFDFPPPPGRVADSSASPGLCFDAACRGLGRRQIRLGGIGGRRLHGDGVLKRLLVQLNKKIFLFHAVVVIRKNTGNLTVNTGRNRANRIQGMPNQSADPRAKTPIVTNHQASVPQKVTAP